MALAPILALTALIIDNPVHDLSRDFQIIRPTLPIIYLSILLFHTSEKYLRGQ